MTDIKPFSIVTRRKEIRPWLIWILIEPLLRKSQSMEKRKKNSRIIDLNVGATFIANFYGHISRRYASPNYYRTGNIKWTYYFPKREMKLFQMKERAEEMRENPSVLYAACNDQLVNWLEPFIDPSRKHVHNCRWQRLHKLSNFNSKPIDICQSHFYSYFLFHLYFSFSCPSSTAPKFPFHRCDGSGNVAGKSAF